MQARGSATDAATSRLYNIPNSKQHNRHVAGPPVCPLVGQLAHFVMEAKLLGQYSVDDQRIIETYDKVDVFEKHKVDSLTRTVLTHSTTSGLLHFVLAAAQVRLAECCLHV